MEVSRSTQREVTPLAPFSLRRLKSFPCFPVNHDTRNICQRRQHWLPAAPWTGNGNPANGAGKRILLRFGSVNETVSPRGTRYLQFSIHFNDLVSEDENIE